MKTQLVTLLMTVTLSLSTQAQQFTLSDRTINKLTIRSADYSVATYNDLVTVNVSPSQIIENCGSTVEYYINAQQDKGILSALLAAKTAKMNVTIIVDNTPSKVVAGNCKIDGLDF